MMYVTPPKMPKEWVVLRFTQLKEIFWVTEVGIQEIMRT